MNPLLWALLAGLCVAVVATLVRRRARATPPYSDSLLVTDAGADTWLSVALPCGPGNDGTVQVYMNKQKVRPFVLRVNDTCAELTSHQVDIVVAVLRQAQKDLG